MLQLICNIVQFCFDFEASLKIPYKVQSVLVYVAMYLLLSLLQTWRSDEYPFYINWDLHLHFSSEIALQNIIN